MWDNRLGGFEQMPEYIRSVHPFEFERLVALSLDGDGRLVLRLRLPDGSAGVSYACSGVFGLQLSLTSPGCQFSGFCVQYVADAQIEGARFLGRTVECDVMKFYARDVLVTFDWDV